MSLPKEPRQKMINIMYLVLTALLALNVSSEILNAFKTVNNSLLTSNDQTNGSTGQIFKSLTDKLNKAEYADKAKIWHPIAKDIMGYAADANSKIEAMKMELMVAAGGSKTDGSGFKDDQLDAATRVFVNKGRGKELLQLLKDFKDKLLKRDTAISAAFANSLPINLEKPKSQTGDNKKNWEESYFHMVPTIAALTILSKFQNDIKVSENKVVTFCHQKVGEVEVQQDAFAAIAVANANYVLPGQEIEVTAGVGGFSTKVKPQISISGQGIPIGDDGTAHYKFNAGGFGTRSIAVHISYTDQNNKVQQKDIEIPYTVGQSNASIGLDKMNVLYIGVDNPVTIAASGGGDDKVQASITGGGGSLTRAGSGKYIARVTTQADNCTITVNIDGKVAGQQVFRVRNIPQAQCYVGGKPSGANVSAGEFKAQGGVGAGIKDFPFELSYDVVSYTFSVDTDDGDIVPVPVSGASFTPQVRNAMGSYLKAGKMVTIDDIRVKGPDGRVLPAPSLIYYIK
jgi:gliding motility-associated protein GldM